MRSHHRSARADAGWRPCRGFPRQRSTVDTAPARHLALEIPSRVSRSNRDRSPRQIGNRSPPPLPEPSQGKQYSSLSRRVRGIQHHHERVPEKENAGRIGARTRPKRDGCTQRTHLQHCVTIDSGDYHKCDLCDLFLLFVGEVIERRHAIGLRPKSDLTKSSKGLIFDLKKRIAIEKYIESFTDKLDPE